MIRRRHVLEQLRILAVFGRRYESGVGQPLACGNYPIRVSSEKFGDVGPCIIERLADDLQCLRTVRAASKDLGGLHGLILPASTAEKLPGPRESLRAHHWRSRTVFLGSRLNCPCGRGGRSTSIGRLPATGAQQSLFKVPVSGRDPPRTF